MRDAFTFGEALASLGMASAQCGRNSGGWQSSPLPNT